MPVRKFSARRRLIMLPEVTVGRDPVSMLPPMSRYPSCCILPRDWGTSPDSPLMKPSYSGSEITSGFTRWIRGETLPEVHLGGLTGSHTNPCRALALKGQKLLMILSQ